MIVRRFRCYRPSPPPEYYAQGAANPPDEIQFEGVVFSDGTCAVRWLTEFRSHSVWASYADLEKIHGHPEYGTVIEWLDPELPGVRTSLNLHLRVMLSGMADDYTGVPSDDWYHAVRDATWARLFAWLALGLAVLLVLTLIEKGILAGWGDLIRAGHVHE
jgi:hypothetical protein